MLTATAVQTAPTPSQGSRVLLKVGKARVTEQDLNTAADTFRGIGHSVEGMWKNLGSDVASVENLPVLKSLSPEDKSQVLNTVLGTARDVGYAAAGTAALAGVARLHSKGARRAEALASIATAGAIATTVSGMIVPAMVLTPVAGACGIVRGGINIVAGALHGDQRQEVCGVVDTTRSVGTIASGLEPIASMTGTLTEVATAFSVVGNTVQIARGLIDLHKGVQVHDDRQELNGLTDIGMAVGGLVAATGVGAIPGAVLAGTSVALKLGYIVCKPLRKKTNEVLDKHQAGLKKGVDRMDAVVDPVLHAGGILIDDVVHRFKKPKPAP